MAVKTHYRSGGVWIEARNGTAVRVSGVWQPIQKIFVRAAGVWQQAFQRITYSNPLPGLSGNQFSDSGEGAAEVELFLYDNGTWVINTANLGTLASGNWGSPTLAGYGNNHWVKFTRTAGSGGPGTTGWLSLSTWASYAVSASYPVSPNRTATITIEIATDSAGVNIVSTTTLVQLSAAASQPV